MFHVVDDLFGKDEALITRFWISEKAAKEFRDYQRKENPKEQFLRKLRRYANNGFKVYEGGRGMPIKCEWNDVFRISDGTLFRLIGFYEIGFSNSFVIIDAFLKRKQKLSSAERDRIAAVVRVACEGSWKKR